VAKPPARDPRALPLQAILTLLFVTIIVATIGGLVLYSHERLARIAEDEARGNFDRVSDGIDAITARAVRTAQVFLETAALSLDTEAPPDRLAPLLTRLLQQVEQLNPSVTGLNLGKANGRFFAVFDLSRGLPSELQRIATDKAAFAVRMGTQTGPGAGEGAAARWMLLDKDLNSLATTALAWTDYDPRLRPWYQDALRARRVVLTAPYQFRPLPIMGITMAQPLERPAGDVLAIDVELGDLGRQMGLLRQSPEMELFIFDRQGNLIAHPDAEQLRMEVNPSAPEALVPIGLLKSPRLRALYDSYQQDPSTKDRLVTIEGRSYLARFEPSSGSVDTLTTAMAYPYDLILGPADHLRTRLLLVGLAAIVVGAVLVMLVSGRVTRPLRELRTDVARIMRFDFEEPPMRRSRIGEIMALDGAVAAMRAGLRQFSRYVPGQLVHNILAHRLQPELGGRRQPLTVLFTDVAGFTSLAETLDPEQLTRMTSRYFSEAGAALVEAGGTIDKYLGDSIMAFWNAPVAQPDHVRQACLGALAAAARIERLNEAFASESIPAMPTRFGLHTGEVVVGTIGSIDRMNYTAMGHVVNLASRIEGLNKRYGTMLLASDAVRRGAGEEFLFRFVDSVIPVGATEPIRLYELLGLRDQRPRDLEPLARWESACGRYYARDWDGALALFDGILATWHGDRLALLYRDRALRYRQDPPPPDWKGVERAETK
jgi:adenylate cyclase